MIDYKKRNISIYNDFKDNDMPYIMLSKKYRLTTTTISKIIRNVDKANGNIFRLRLKDKENRKKSSIEYQQNKDKIYVTEDGRIDLTETSRLLGITLETLYVWNTQKKLGNLKRIKLGKRYYFYYDDIMNWLKNRKDENKE